jgi:hypothetical protein
MAGSLLKANGQRLIVGLLINLSNTHDRRTPEAMKMLVCSSDANIQF